ncbi:MAG: HAMP domain-containing histidine kinase [Holosporaceae bacterium]|jgi:signal transduction histidine kinase|nr:HAMP domain-containing histidine kinase [Holosporaceae bacterium]
MYCKTHIKWNHETLNFLEAAADNSLEPIFIVSHASKSQTFEGFEEFVNSINCENIKRKIKKLHILDASYLYRHCIRGFLQLSDPNVHSIWLLNNRDAIKRIECEVVIDSWIEQINDDAFRHWHNKIVVDASGDKNGTGAIPEIKRLLEANVALKVAKNKGSATGCLNFLIEEYAHTCAFLKDAVVIYPQPFSQLMQLIIAHHNLNITHLRYNLSNRTRSRKEIRHDHKAITQEIISVLSSEALKTNIFAVDKRGEYIYKSDAVCELAGDSQYVIDPIAWEISLDVMKKGKRAVVEEEFSGTTFVSVKAPLIINGKIGGVIGISVDITSQKKAELLESQNNMQKKMRCFTEQVIHDIRSPLAALSMFAKICANISENDRIMLQSIVGNIDEIANGLLSRYKEYDKQSLPIEKKHSNILLDLVLQEMIKHKLNQHTNLTVSFDYAPDLSNRHVFIDGDALIFNRMMSNLINNAVESIPGGNGTVKIAFSTKNQHVKIIVADNGVGMPPEIVNKIMNNLAVDSTKECGYGIGIKQITGAVQELGATMHIDSEENVGTSIEITIPTANAPGWFLDRLALRNGSLLVILDDDVAVHRAWEKIFASLSSDLSFKYFTRGDETIDFINSYEEKERIFLLSDYELRTPGLTGLDVITRTSLEEQSIIVTNGYNRAEVQDFSGKTEVKIMPKQYMQEIIIITVPR